jgi:DNA polymerase III alpha subunit (gram-positive type)
MIKFIGLDCETGGFAGTSLLSFFFGIYDENYQLLDGLELFVKPKDGIYHVTAEALGINGINLINHDKVAVTYEAGGKLLWDFLVKHSDNGKNKLLPLGHNVYFDIQRLTPDLMTKKTWNMFVSYRLVDLGGIVTALKLAGKLPHSISGSLGSICKHFGVQLTNAHDAKADVTATVECVKHCVELMK